MPGQVYVLAEQTDQTTEPDEPFVRRCWHRPRMTEAAVDYTELDRVMQRERISILHLNCQARFFSQPQMGRFLQEIRARGVQVVSQLHNLYTCSEDLRRILESSDRILVHTAENRLEAIANGAQPDRVLVVPHGVQRLSLSPSDRMMVRRGLGIADDENLITAFGFVQPHKGMQAVIEAVAHLRIHGIQARGLIVGETRLDDPHSEPYLVALRGAVATQGLSRYVDFITSFVSEEQLSRYIAASDLLMMNYHSQHYEASGACSLAVGSGVPVLASLAPAMMSFGPAVWHLTSGYGPGLSAEIVFTNKDVRQALCAAAKEYADSHAWSEIAQKVFAIYTSLRPSTVRGTSAGVGLRKEEPSMNPNQVWSNQGGRTVRVLMQNRPNTFTQRGGDTVVLEQLRSGLQARGFEVEVDLEGLQDPARFDLVHLFNCATTSYTEKLAKRCTAAGTPFVLTTLYEDVPQFHNQSHALALCLQEYVNRGQDREWWRQAAAGLDMRTVPPAQRFQCEWLVRNAAALFVNGAGEAAALQRDYGALSNLVTVPLGHEVSTEGSAAEFEREYGVKDFILCVGRIETRKNQLMLLKALEESELPVVLAGGGFSYQPEYEQAVRSFRRKGKTIILGALSPRMLASAYAAARVHVLPSWYELPGLVSLEAAVYGKNVVVTRTGTTADYLGENAFYCHAWSEDSIASAVTAAYYAPLKQRVAEVARSWTWQRCVAEAVRGYEQVLSIGRRDTSHTVSAVYDMSSNPAEFQDALEGGELAARNMDFDRALELLQAAHRLDPHSARALKALGAVYLAQSEIEKARPLFERALAISPQDTKILTGCGMCDIAQGDHARAAQLFKRALEVAPDHLVAVYQFMECAYKLNRLDELAQVLQRYLALHPEDCEVRYCAAGCCYKRGDLDGTREELERVFSVNPTHAAALELWQMVESAAEPRPTTKVSESASQSSSGLHESLRDLSRRMNEWRVAQTPRTATTVREVPNVELPKVEVMPPSAPPAEAVRPNVLTVQSLNSSQVEEIFAQVDDLRRQRLFDQARAEFAKVEACPQLTPAQRERVQCMRAEFMVLDGQLSEAGAEFDRIVRNNPYCARALCGQGAIAGESERWSEAQGCFERALQAEPSYDVALAGLGLCAMVRNENERALDLYMLALKRNPENYRALYGVLQLGYPLKRYTQIEEVLINYLDLHPGSLDMLYSLAGVLFKQGRLVEAKREVEKILLLEPANARARELYEMIGNSTRSEARV
jgi:glycosyltransferase involved in cell wall biosynthesis/Tfp pilus assembly protein PilF